MKLKGIKRKRTIIEEISIKDYIDDTTKYWAQIEEKDNNIYALIIRTDPFPNDPREDDSFLSVIVSDHRRYDFTYNMDIDIVEEFKNDYEKIESKEEYEELKNKYIGLKPLYMLDHSGVTLSTSPFTDKWDSGQVGFVFTTEEKIYDRMGSTFDYKNNMDIISNMIDYEVQVFDQYIRGNCYEMFLIDLKTKKYLNSWSNLIWCDNDTQYDIIEDFLSESGFGKFRINDIELHDQWDRINDSDIIYDEIIDETQHEENVDNGKTEGE